jgi:hypothetical protein
MVFHSIEGFFEARTYNSKNELVNIHKGKNTLTKAGFKRVCEILVQGFSDKYSSKSLIKTNDGGLFGDSEGVNLKIVDWKDRKESTFNNYLLSDGMFNDGEYSDLPPVSSDVMSKLNEKFYQDDPVYCDFGQKNVYDEEYIFSSTINYLGRPNVKFGSIMIKKQLENGEELVLIDGEDYVVTNYGDYIRCPEIKLLKEEHINVSLYITYTIFSVPSKPIVGFCFDYYNSKKVSTFNDAFTSSQNYIAGWAWSLNQGEGYLPCFFPNVSGDLSGSSNTIFSELMTQHNNSWFSLNGENEKRYYFTSLPYGVINPTQLAWYIHANSNVCHYFSNFQLLTIEPQKNLVDSIKIGTGIFAADENTTEDSTELKEFLWQCEIDESFNDELNTVVFETHLGFEEGNSEKDITEIGLFFAEEEDYYKRDEYWNSKNNISEDNNNCIVKILGSPEKSNTMFSHGKFDIPWKKTSQEKVVIVYKLKINFDEENNE